jgi:hypothetical protein
MIGFFSHFKEKARQENMDEKAFNRLFSGLRGIALLDTLGESEKNIEEIEKLHAGLQVVETKSVGLDKLKQLLLEGLERNKQKTRTRCAQDS